MKAPGGRAALWFNYAVAKGGTQQDGTVIPSADGFGLGFRHASTEFHGGYNELSVGHAKGAASNLNTSLDDPTRFLRHAEKLLIQENFLIQPNPKFAIIPLFIYQRSRDGKPQDGPAQWYSFGARPQFFFTNHISLAFEPGFDRVTAERPRSNHRGVTDRNREVDREALRHRRDERMHVVEEAVVVLPRRSRMTIVIGRGI